MWSESNVYTVLKASSRRSLNRYEIESHSKGGSTSVKELKMNYKLSSPSFEACNTALDKCRKRDLPKKRKKTLNKAHEESYLNMVGEVHNFGFAD